MSSPYRPKFLDIGSNLPNRIIIQGSFTVGANGAITAITPNGSGLAATIAADGSAVQGLLFTVTHPVGANAATYTITPSEQYLKLGACRVERFSPTATGTPDLVSLRTAPFGSVTANSLTIYAITTSTGVLTDLAVGTVITFELDFINSVSPRT